MIDNPEARRFPPPWIAEETDACFIVRDANRQALAYVYFEEEPGRRAAAHLLTRDEARRIAANVAKLPHLLLEYPRRDSKMAAGAFSAFPCCGLPTGHTLTGPPVANVRPTAAATCAEGGSMGARGKGGRVLVVR